MPIIPEYRPEICIYHGDCLDGFGAAWAISLKWACDFRPGWYGKPLPLDGVEGKHVLFVDFSAPAADLVALAQRAASVVVLDHHKTAEAELAPFLRNKHDIDSCYQHLADCISDDKPPIVAYFDMERSGASMAWELASQGGPYRMPDLLAFIEDRDLWRFRMGDTTRAVCAALQSYPMDFETWGRWRHSASDLINEGHAILRANRMTVEKLLRSTRWEEIAGHNVPVVNAPYQFASDVGNELLIAHPDAPFAATFHIGADGSRHWSLRSTDERRDVSAIATMFGGGGHRNAAGFKQTVYRPEEVSP
jgi:hypothetical protein